ncbi:MAG: serine/threonine protein kinase [Rubrivivax sp.]|nr:serine/threonine protein kinase [Rubrivivax sp.]
MSASTPERRTPGMECNDLDAWHGLAADWPTIDRLLDEALALPPGQRAGLLATHADLTDSVRSTVERLLAADARMQTAQFMQTLPPLGLSGAGPPDPALPGVGDRIGPWRLLRLIGEGGMGQVFLAERADGQMTREVALKLPRLGWIPGLVERLARERDILAALTHPHIARLYDAGVDTAGRPWLALEHVDGLPLTDWCERRGSNVAERLQLLLQVADAVSAAHARLVVHRDLKPANILVTSQGQAMLLDFGIAGLVRPDGAAGATVLGPRALTLDYASPEQVRGEALGTASDVYSLGVVAYELLTGVRPYQPRRASAAALEDAIERDDAPAASRACTAVARRRALRGDLDAILAKALRKQPAQRYASVDAFAQDMRRHLAHEPVQAQPDRQAYRAAKFVRRHALPVAAASAVTAALAVGLGIALVQAEAARASAAQARASEGQARQEAQRAGLVGNTLLNTFSRVAADPAFRTPDARARIGEALQTELDRLEVEVQHSPSGVAETHGVAASIFNYLQQPDRQLRAARREQQLLVAAGESPLRIGESHRQLALALARQGDSAAALDEALAGLRVLQDDASPDQRLLRGRLHRAAGRYARQAGLAARAYAHTAAALQSLQGIDARQLEPNIQHLGAALAEHAINAAMIDRDDEALHALSEVDALYATPRKALREADRADVELARCHVDLARGQPASAALACQQALTLYAPQFGAVGRNADTVDAVRATALVRAGALEEAAPVLQRIREGGTGVDAWLPSAEWALARGDLAQAEAWLARQRADDLPSQPWRRVELHRLTAALRLAQGRPADAAAQAQAGLALVRQSMPGAWRAERDLREALAHAEAAPTR